MLITNHSLVGGLVGRAVGRPVPALLAGLASHYLLDVMPHWGYSVAGSEPSEPDEPLPDEAMPIAVGDGLLGLSAVAAVAWWTRGSLPALAGVVGACLPDLDKPGVLFAGRSPWPAAHDRWHARIQVGREAPHRLPHEVAVAVVLAAAASAVLPRGR